VELSPVGTPPVPPGVAARRRRRRVALLVILVGIVAGVFRPRSASDEPSPASSAAPHQIVQRPTRMVGDSVRIRVEVINATDTRGLGRLATAWLRDHGFDVIGVGTAPEAGRLDSSLVLDRSGHPDWARLAAVAMGGARIESRPDSLRYLDLTVLVGRSWRAPPQSLYP
jgi:hypothetical protein